MHKKILLLFLIIVFSVTPLVGAQNYDFQEMKYSVYLMEKNSSLNINPVFQIQNDLNKLSFDVNFDGKKFRIGGSWLIKVIEEEGYETDVAFSILSKEGSSSFTAGLGVEGKRYLKNDKKLLYKLRYILANKQFEYRIGYATPIVENNDLIISLGNSYWFDKPIMLEIGFLAKF